MFFFYPPKSVKIDNGATWTNGAIYHNPRFWPALGFDNFSRYHSTGLTYQLEWSQNYKTKNHRIDRYIQYYILEDLGSISIALCHPAIQPVPNFGGEKDLQGSNASSNIWLCKQDEVTKLGRAK